MERLTATYSDFAGYIEDTTMARVATGGGAIRVPLAQSSAHLVHVAVLHTDCAERRLSDFG